ncbi:MAG: G5 domain-containing protein [Anaerolineales bacterium]|nr:G5 domain-containing protein [Anaerolineales bacterium]
MKANFARQIALANLALLLLLTACAAPRVRQNELAVSVIADGVRQQVSLPAGSTVQDALDTLELGLGQLDRVDPPVYTILSEGTGITVTRVREVFETQQVLIPFEHQELRNESLPAGESRLIQPGQNGLKEITIRHLYEDEVEVSSSVVSETLLQPATAEIVMVGVQTPFAPLPIPGRIVYMATGNAWAMEGTTAVRRPLVTTGDLDGRVFSLSPDGEYLLFTRRSEQDPTEEINTLWAISTTSPNPTLINLRVSNVVHYAGWVPESRYTIAYSTVEPRATAPGWQANNDLYYMIFHAWGQRGNSRRILDSNAGGIYGWWGTVFAPSPDGRQIAYTRPDGIGLVDAAEGGLVSLLDITPLNTHSDWAWIPGLAWGADGRTLFVVTHAPPSGLVSPEESPFFDLTALSLANSANVRISTQTGMFAYPASSPARFLDPEKSYRLAYLEAIFPAQSETSRYHLIVMDRDGSNRQVLFPDEGLPGIEPQTPVWAPVLTDGGDFIALLYQGNLWLVDSISGQAQQITGDGLISRIDWK